MKFNMENSKSIRSNTGYKGVVFDKQRGLFRAQLAVRLIRFQTVRAIYIGEYSTLKEAVKAREDFIKSLF